MNVRLLHGCVIAPGDFSGYFGGMLNRSGHSSLPNAAVRDGRFLRFVSRILCVGWLIASTGLMRAGQEVTVDVCVYGGTSGGVMAAVQAKRMGKTVALVSPTAHLGGLTSSGLGWTDLGNASILGGLSREFYHRVYLHYQKDSSWNWQTRESFGNSGQNGPAFNHSTKLASVFEPKVAETIFKDLLAEHSIPVFVGLLDLTNGVVMRGKHIRAFRTEDGNVFRAKMFIDASYEGDLLAKAGVSYTVGREANATYNEVRNGIQVAAAVKNQLPDGIDPYVEPGNPASGLLKSVNADAGGPDGAADDKLQAYCYRMVLTDTAENRVLIAKPEGYDEHDYELVFRAIAAGQTSGFFKLDRMPNRKTDSNNSGGISTDFIGGNYGSDWNWAEADHARRAASAKEHENWQRGLVWTLQNHPSVPQSIRDAYARWGLPADEFTDNNHWPYQIYVREARRMISDYVMTRANCTGAAVAPDSVGMAAYTMDSHNTQRHVKNGFVKNEGDVQDPTAGPYPVSYRSIVPKAGECENLLVPWCLSASHIAFGSIRMEPVFMILSQSAATAACFAIDDNVSVQEVGIGKLQAQLIADGQQLGIPKGTNGSGNLNLRSLLLDFGPTSVITAADSINDPAHAVGELSAVQDRWNTGIVADVASGLFFSDDTPATGVSINLGRSAAGSPVINFNDHGFVTGALGGAQSSGIYANNSPVKDGFWGSSSSANAHAVGVRIDGLPAGTYSVYVAGRNTSTSATASQRFFGTNGPAAPTFAFANAPSVIQGNSSPAVTDSFVFGDNCQVLVSTIAAGESLYIASVGVPEVAEQRGFINAIAIMPGMPAFLSRQPVVNLWATDAHASRWGPEPGKVTVSRTVNTNVPVTIHFQYAGTSTNGVDFQAAPNSMLIPAGVGLTNITILPLASAVPVGDQSAIVSLVTNENYALGSFTNTAITIHDVPFHAWKLDRFGPDVNDVSIAGDLAAPAGDGVPNIVKYAFGLDPKIPAHLGLLKPSMGTNGCFRFSYTRPDPRPLDITYQLETSNDLSVWAENAADLEIQFHDNDTATVSSELPEPISARSSKFVRLKIER